ncbi:ATP-binding protein [Bifidobacterium xylocopae]|uniref:ATP-binding protein n=1 Tax=Bifidobacterium xylocopae TaxID=2493119 RepID=A0A366KD74_9BIFI|nr:ATP-binding protein [Bifidobacterium xylocopae]RBP99654.1 ATP-binding protein [Bifidobacterium xylocopae]
MSGAQIFNALPDIPRLYTGISEWLSCLVYLLAVRRRVCPARTALVLSLGLPVMIGVQYWAGLQPISFWILGICLAAALMCAIIRLGSGADAPAVVYLGVRAFVLAELVASLHWQLDSFLRPGDVSIYSPASVLLLISIYGGCAALTWWIERRNFAGGLDREMLPTHSVMIALVIGVVTFAMSNLSFVSTNTPFSGRVGLEVFYIRTLVDLCGFAILYAQQEQLRQSHASAELDSINARLESQHREYVRSKRNLDAMARISHDLKHRIAALRAEVDPERKSRNFEELEASVQRYGSQQHTGNPVLDVVLSSKEQVCAQEGISLSVVADGGLLDGMSSMDVSTLFGNALDNAIEALRQVGDRERRLLRLALYGKGRMLLIRVENYFTTPLRWKADGELGTTKGGGGLHGYGVKSIRHIAHKYGGEVSIGTDDHWFRLCILLPRNADSQDQDTRKRGRGSVEAHGGFGDPVAQPDGQASGFAGHVDQPA